MRTAPKNGRCIQSWAALDVAVVADLFGTYTTHITLSRNSTALGSFRRGGDPLSATTTRIERFLIRNRFLILRLAATLEKGVHIRLDQYASEPAIAGRLEAFVGDKFLLGNADWHCEQTENWPDLIISKMQITAEEPTDTPRPSSETASVVSLADVRRERTMRLMHLARICQEEPKFANLVLTLGDHELHTIGDLIEIGPRRLTAIGGNRKTWGKDLAAFHCWLAEKHGVCLEPITEFG